MRLGSKNRWLGTIATRLASDPERPSLASSARGVEGVELGVPGLVADVRSRACGDKQLTLGRGGKPSIDGGLVPGHDRLASGRDRLTLGHDRLACGDERLTPGDRSQRPGDRPQAAGDRPHTRIDPQARGDPVGTGPGDRSHLPRDAPRASSLVRIPLGDRPTLASPEGKARDVGSRRRDDRARRPMDERSA